MLGVATDHDDEGEQDQADDEEHLAERSPEFSLAIPLDSNDINQGVQDNNYGYHGGSGYCFGPEIDDEVAGRHFEGDQSGLKDEEVPANGKPKGLVDVATGESDKGRRDGQIGYHFSHAQGDGKNDSTPKGKGDEETTRAAMEKALTNLNLQAYANTRLQ
ncbi:hypothetical protein NQ176_g10473 [Zarea fungicola]|uniref:Uncharacterized protein n=1 Tax=Zarea fungicola TaxID=93591 RepID=A0ACC1MHK0_9HYPO|nr:hypothetical protein NQ176_g10473 [Lecanicillium fungicola]